MEEKELNRPNKAEQNASITVNLKQHVCIVRICKHIKDLKHQE